MEEYHRITCFFINHAKAKHDAQVVFVTLWYHAGLSTAITVIAAFLAAAVMMSSEVASAAFVVVV